MFFIAVVALAKLAIAVAAVIIVNSSSSTDSRFSTAEAEEVVIGQMK